MIIFAAFDTLWHMNIIVAGIGEVGTHLATKLSKSTHRVMAIDPDPANLQRLNEQADLGTLLGSATSIPILQKAEVGHTDLFIAVAHAETTNIIAALLAKKLGASRVIARIDTNEYLEQENKRLLKDMGIDTLIYPEKLASQVVIGMLGETGTSEMVDFSDGRLVFSTLQIDNDTPFAGQTLEAIAKRPWHDDYRIAAIARMGQTIIPRGYDTLLPGDNIYVISTKRGIEEWRRQLGGEHFQVNSLIVVGASRIGIRTCLDLEGKVKSIKLIENDPEKCRTLRPHLHRTLLLNGDGRDTDFLIEEGLDSADAFVSVTGDSETNILTSMAAKRAGAKQIIAEVENFNYISLAESIGIDNVINKKLIAASYIYRYTMEGGVIDMRYLSGTDAEVVEFEAQSNSLATRSRLKDLNFPRNSIAGGVIHDGKASIATGDTIIEPGDRVVVFALGSALQKLEKFFKKNG